MWRGVLLVRPGTWLCLLGSALALVAFFVPYFRQGRIYRYKAGMWKSLGRALAGLNFGGRIYRYKAGMWKRDTLPSGSGVFTRVWMLSPQEGWAVGFGTILHYQDGLWQEATNPFPRDALESISMISPTQGWIVRLRGATLQYVNGQ